MWLFYVYGLLELNVFEDLSRLENIWMPWTFTEDQYPEWFPKRYFEHSSRFKKECKETVIEYWRSAITFLYEATLKNPLFEVRWNNGFHVHARRSTSLVELTSDDKNKMLCFIEYQFHQVLDKKFDVQGINCLFEDTEQNIGIVFGPASLLQHDGNSLISLVNKLENDSDKVIEYVIRKNAFTVENEGQGNGSLHWLSIEHNNLHNDNFENNEEEGYEEDYNEIETAEELLTRHNSFNGWIRASLY